MRYTHSNSSSLNASLPIRSSSSDTSVAARADLSAASRRAVGAFSLSGPALAALAFDSSAPASSPNTIVVPPFVTVMARCGEPRPAPEPVAVPRNRGLAPPGSGRTRWRWNRRSDLACALAWAWPLSRHFIGTLRWSIRCLRAPTLADVAASSSFSSAASRWMDARRLGRCALTVFRAHSGMGRSTGPLNAAPALREGVFPWLDENERSAIAENGELGTEAHSREAQQCTCENSRQYNTGIAAARGSEWGGGGGAAGHCVRTMRRATGTSSQAPPLALAQQRLGYRTTLYARHHTTCEQGRGSRSPQDSTTQAPDNAPATGGRQPLSASSVFHTTSAPVH